MKTAKISDYTLREVRAWYKNLPDVWKFILGRQYELRLSLIPKDNTLGNTWHGRFCPSSELQEHELKHLLAITSIRASYYGDRGWSEEEWLDLSSITALDRLEELSFSATVLKNWPAIRSFKRLKGLYVSNSGVRYGCFRNYASTAPLRRLRNLEMLCFDGNMGQLHIDLADLTRLPLKDLTISDTKIKTIGSEDAKSLQYLRDLAYLNIRDTQISTLAHIWELPLLEQVLLPVTIRQSEATAFEKEHANCWVIHPELPLYKE